MDHGGPRRGGMPSMAICQRTRGQDERHHQARAGQDETCLLERGGGPAAMEWAATHLHRPIALAHISAATALSERTLGRRFERPAGTTPMMWLAMQRVERAKELLETAAAPIDRIAAAVGMGTGANVRTIFKKSTSLTQVRTGTLSTPATASNGADPRYLSQERLSPVYRVGCRDARWCIIASCSGNDFSVACRGRCPVFHLRHCHSCASEAAGNTQGQSHQGARPNSATSLSSDDGERPATRGLPQ